MQAQPAELPTPSLQALKQRAHQLLESQRSLQQQNQALDAERFAFQSERDRLATQHQELSAERDALQAERDSLTAHLQELTAQRDSFQIERDGLQSERDHQATQYQELSAERDALQAERDSLSAHLQELTAQRDSIQQKRETLQTTVEDLQGQLTAQSAQTAEQRQQCEVLQCRIDSLCRDLFSAEKYIRAQNAGPPLIANVSPSGRVEPLSNINTCRDVEAPVIIDNEYMRSLESFFLLESIDIDRAWKIVRTEVCQYRELILKMLNGITSGELLLHSYSKDLQLPLCDWVKPPTLSISRYGAIFTHGRNELIGKSLALYGEWAQNEIDFLLLLLHIGDVVIDVGAFIGTHALAFARKVGADGHVHAFEPNPSSFVLLNQNCLLQSEFNSITTYDLALGSSKSDLVLHTPNPDNLGHSIASEASIDSSGLLVHATALDLIPGIDSLALIKIDSEGFESQVLAGSNETIARCKPFIYAEVNSIENCLLLLNWASKACYVCYGVTHAAFNSSNFLEQDLNIFGDSKECAFLMLHHDKVTSQVFSSLTSIRSLTRISTLDDAARLLCTKPQFVNHMD